MSCFVASRSSSNWLHFTGWMGREKEDEIRRGERREEERRRKEDGGGEGRERKGRRRESR